MAAAGQRHTVAVVAQHDTNPFELSVACEVFGLERPELGVPWYRFLVVAAVDPPVRLRNFMLDTPHGLGALRTADTIIVPIGFPERQPPPGLVDALRAAHRRGARLVSYCSGAFVLAAAGLLDHRRATTHWMYATQLAQQYPLIDVEGDVLYVEDGNVLTSAGTSAAIDVSLHIVRTDYGSDIANAVARRMVVPPHRDGGQSQFVDRPVAEALDSDGLAPTLDWAVEHLHEPLTIERLAEHAMTSPRTFMRRFRATTGTTPLRWLLQQRVLHARHLLEDTGLSIDRIAERAGFGSAANLRVHFTRIVGTTPTAYRRAFRSEITNRRRPAAAARAG
jgi:AraC family transcriptional activator FtrA